MTAVAGTVSLAGANPGRGPCGAMLRRLSCIGPDRCDIVELGQAVFGRALHRFVPEDDFDRQPFIGGGGRYLLTASVRIDNRDELASRLDLDTRQLSDAALLLACWERSQLAAFDYLLGDIACAVWDQSDRSLTVARSPLATRGLFYHNGRKVLAFASLPQALRQVPGVPWRLCTFEAVAVAAAASLGGEQTLFEGIHRVRHGEAIVIRGGQARSVALWNPSSLPRLAGSAEQLGEAMRAELDRAVQAQVRRRSGPLAVHLSSGRDSSAVTSSAATLLAGQNDRIVALTGAPRVGLPDLKDHRYLQDESALARATAERYPNVEHIISRPQPAAFVPLMNRLQNAHFGPLLNPSNMRWWDGVLEAAAARGARVLLTGQRGNFSISAGGPEYFADLWRSGNYLSWLGRALTTGRSSPRAWASLLNASFGRALPPFAYRSLQRATGRTRIANPAVPLLRQPYRAQAESHLAELLGDPRPHERYQDYRLQVLDWVDNADQTGAALWGIDVRDPTADRRLMELCLAFPPGRLASRGQLRPIYEAAFRDRVPKAVSESRRRGYQGADWYELFEPQEIRVAVAKYRRNVSAAELIDFDLMEMQLEDWPGGDPQSRRSIDLYRNKLLGTVALAAFIDANFPN